MKKAAPVLVVAFLGLVLGVLIWWLTRGDTLDTTPDDGGAQANKDFKPEDFIPTFDVNGDKQVTYEEFVQRYGKSLSDDAPVLIFHEDDDGPALTAADAFKRWDRNADGIVDWQDMQSLEHTSWRAFQDEAEAKGLKAVSFGDRWLMLNTHQLKTYDTETGALAREEQPFAGKFWASKYLGNWATLMDADGDTREGYLSKTETRLFLLTDDAKLSVFDPAKVDVTEAGPDDPHNLYAAEVKKTKFDDVQANLALARKCVEWGMRTEADMLYARVLIFAPTNEEALNALGYTEKDGHYTEGN